MHLIDVIALFLYTTKSLQELRYKRRRLDGGNVYSIRDFCNYTYQTQNRRAILARRQKQSRYTDTRCITTCV